MALKSGCPENLTTYFTELHLAKTRGFLSSKDFMRLFVSSKSSLMTQLHQALDNASLAMITIFFSEFEIHVDATLVHQFIIQHLRRHSLCPLSKDPKPDAAAIQEYFTGKIKTFSETKEPWKMAKLTHSHSLFSIIPKDSDRNTDRETALPSISR